MTVLNRAEFEAMVRREGYDIREGAIDPNVHREAHTHDWDARLFVLDGHLTLVRGADRETFGPGGSCSLSAGTLHEEHTGPDGVKYVAARRNPAPPAGK
jgi:quercetin dioxygenase-like cupin family protein